ncbi:hypothetical protein M8J77_020588 [Diaphorina citri]|nr:hypothetical protein M8J77_020588 [Diaphorina citri]
MFFLYFSTSHVGHSVPTLSSINIGSVYSIARCVETREDPDVPGASPRQCNMVQVPLSPSHPTPPTPIVYISCEGRGATSPGES